MCLLTPFFCRHPCKPHFPLQKYRPCVCLPSPCPCMYCTVLAAHAAASLLSTVIPLINSPWHLFGRGLAFSRIDLLTFLVLFFYYYFFTIIISMLGLLNNPSTSLTAIPDAYYVSQHQQRRGRVKCSAFICKQGRECEGGECILSSSSRCQRGLVHVSNP